MDFFAALQHLLNFVAPALALALGLATAARFILPRTGQGLAWWLQVVLHFVLGCAVLLGGLWWFGRDGKLATYAALLFSAACWQWIFSRGWRV